MLYFFGGEKMDEILTYFPFNIRKEIINSKYDLNKLEEIRIRNNKPIFLRFGQEEEIINYVMNSKSILEILQKICDNSIYTYQNQICNRIYNN